jgi:hypothetical protein
MPIRKLYEDYLIEQDDSDVGRAFAHIKSECLYNLITAALTEGKDSLGASKYLLEFNYRDKKNKQVLELAPKDNTILEEAYALLNSQGEKGTTGV